MRELRRSNQRGFGLLIILALLGVFIATAMVTVARGATSSSARAAQTQQALTAARQALIAYAASVPLPHIAGDPTVCPAGQWRPDWNNSCARPGELPCPDLNNDGWADGPCYNPAAPSTTRLIGRLPYKTLGLPDLRDGDGERLWYAVSPVFVDNMRTTGCSVPASPGCLNSSSKGQITVRDVNALIVNNPNPGVTVPQTIPTGAVALIIAPGAVLTRLDRVTPQDRSCTGDSNLATCRATQVCTGVGAQPNVVYSATALCNPVNYLDIMQAPVKAVAGTVGNREDNATFTQNATTDGFISGPIYDTTGLARLNDIIQPVTLTDIMVPTQQRVAREVLNCLKSYAGSSYGSGRYPWAVDVTNAFPSTGFFQDKSNTYFGHVPDHTQLSYTRFDSGSTMQAIWTDNCTLTFSASSWWMNWKDLVFYGVAPDYAPSNAPAPASCATANCLTVSPLTSTKEVIVIVAGPIIANETRSTTCNVTGTPCNSPSNYLEGFNLTDWTTNAAGSTDTYQTGTASASFNDLVVYQ